MSNRIAQRQHGSSRVIWFHLWAPKCQWKCWIIHAKRILRTLPTSVPHRQKRLVKRSCISAGTGNYTKNYIFWTPREVKIERSSRLWTYLPGFVSLFRYPYNDIYLLYSRNCGTRIYGLGKQSMWSNIKNQPTTYRPVEGLFSVHCIVITFIKHFSSTHRLKIFSLTQKTMLL